MSISFDAVISALMGVLLVGVLYVIICRAIRRDESRHFGFPHQLPIKDLPKDDEPLKREFGKRESV